VQHSAANASSNALALSFIAISQQIIDENGGKISERMPKPTGSLPSSMSTATSHDATEAMVPHHLQAASQERCAAQSLGAEFLI
jgi:hypothetical protein